jgi:hypothetical protein
MALEAIDPLGTPFAATKQCAAYPRESEGAHWPGWSDLTHLYTTQFVLPAEAKEATTSLRLRSSAGDFSAFYQDESLHSKGGLLVVPYPPKASPRGAPVHLTLVPDSARDGAQGDGTKIQALWISFRAANAVYDCSQYDHCCTIVDDIPAAGIASGTCDLQPPRWQCYEPSGAPWRLGQPVGAVTFLGPLAGSSMADGGSVLIHLEDGADVSTPISNTYVEHPVRDDAGCAAVCAAIQASPTLDLYGRSGGSCASSCQSTCRTEPCSQPQCVGCYQLVDASACVLSGRPRIRSAPGFGPIVVNGFGRVNGRRMMERMQMSGQPVWNAPSAGVLNGYGGSWQRWRTLKDAEQHTRWRIMSGLVELSSRAQPEATGRRYAVDVSELTVGWGPKRGDGTVRLQFVRVPLGGENSIEANNQPARLYDVKTPGTWVDAADGPRITADRSYLGYLYLHTADDNIKVDSSFSLLEHLTLVQGNIGSAIELGTYGIGIRRNTLTSTLVQGVYVHRVTQSGGMDDNLGSLLGSRTCPWGLAIEDVSIRNVFVPRGVGNRIESVVRVGTYGQPSARFQSLTNLDRWYFCSNDWWLDDQVILGPNAHKPAAIFRNVSFSGWNVQVTPRTVSSLYGFHRGAPTVFENVTFDTVQVDRLVLEGVHELPATLFQTA